MNTGAYCRRSKSGDEQAAGTLLRLHVTVQGEKFFDLMRGLDKTSVRRTG